MEEIKVLNFGCYLAGPLCAKYLQQMGAKVTTVKAPKDHMQYLKEQNWNREIVHELCRNQDVIHIDLKKDVSRLQTLIRECDVLIENFSPLVMDRLGLSYEYCKMINPSLIYVSLPGFASTDGEFANVKAYEACLLAVTGIFKDMGLNRQLMGVTSSFSDLPLASVYGSIFGALAVISKLILLKRTDDIVNTKIEIPLASALSEALVHNSLDFPFPYSYLNTRKRYLLDKNKRILTYDEINEMMDCFYSHYVCKDNRPLYIVAPYHRKHQERLLLALDLNDDLQKLCVADPYDCDTHKKYGLGGNQTGFPSEDLKKKIQGKIATKNSFYWEQFLGSRGVPCSAHRTFVEWLKSKHALRSGLVTFRNDQTVELGPLTWFEDIITGSIELPRNPSCCLSDVKVLDCSNVIAGPTIGLMLARMGADVIKIDNTKPSYSPVVTIVYGISANQGKKSILLDLSTTQGRSKFEKLVSETHIIIQNTTYKRMHKSALDVGSLRRINPNILLVHFDAWGGPRRTFMNENLGYDDNVQAAQGIMERFGGGLATVEEHAHIGTIDVIAGVAGAVASVGALFNSLTKRKVCVCRCSLSSVGQYLQFPFACGTLRKLNTRSVTSRDRLGIANRGRHPLYRCYDAGDCSFIFIASLDFKPKLLSSIVKELTHLDVCPKHAEQVLLEIFKTRSFVDWCTLLHEKYCLVKLNSITDIRNKYKSSLHMIKNTYHYLTREDGNGGYYTMVSNVAIRTEHVKYWLHMSPKYGAHSSEIINETNAWSKNYVPYSNECPICLDVIQKPLKLRCEHYICVKCATKCSLEGINECPICRCEQEMDETKIIANVVNFKKKYASWRKGNCKGARDMEHIRRIQSTHIISSHTF